MGWTATGCWEMVYSGGAGEPSPPLCSELQHIVNTFYMHWQTHFFELLHLRFSDQCKVCIIGRGLCVRVCVCFGGVTPSKVERSSVDQKELEL